MFLLTGCVLCSALSGSAGGDLSERHPGEFLSVCLPLVICSCHSQRRYCYLCFLSGSYHCILWQNLKCVTWCFLDVNLDNSINMCVFFPHTSIDFRCMSLMAPSWCTGMHWIHRKHLQVNLHINTTHLVTQILTCLNYLHGNFEMIDYIMRYNNIWNSVIRFNRNHFRVLWNESDQFIFHH